MTIPENPNNPFKISTTSNATQKNSYPSSPQTLEETAMHSIQQAKKSRGPKIFQKAINKVVDLLPSPSTFKTMFSSLKEAITKKSDVPKAAPNDYVISLQPPSSQVLASDAVDEAYEVNASFKDLQNGAQIGANQQCRLFVKAVKLLQNPDVRLEIPDRRTLTESLLEIILSSLVPAKIKQAGVESLMALGVNKDQALSNLLAFETQGDQTLEGMKREGVEYLLKMGADKDKALVNLMNWDTKGDASRMQAKVQGAVHLLSLGSNPNGKAEGVSLLDMAVARSEHQLIQTFLEAGCKPVRAYGEPLLAYVEDKESRQALLSKEPELQNYAFEAAMAVHRFALKGQASRLEGLKTAVALGEMQKTSRQFASQLPEEIREEVLEAIENADKRPNTITDDLVNQIKQGRLFAMATDYKTEKGYHAVGIVICGDYLVKCNRGERGADVIAGLTVYRIGNKDALKQALEKFVENQYGTQHDQFGWQFFEKGLNNYLKLIQVGEKRHKDQSIGNCAFASSKLLLEASLLVKGLPQTDVVGNGEFVRASNAAGEGYKTFTAFDREQGIDHLVQAIISLPREPGTLAKMQEWDLLHPAHLLADLMAKLKMPAQQALMDKLIGVVGARPDLFNEQDKLLLQAAQEPLPDRLGRLTTAELKNDRRLLDVVLAKILDRGDFKSLRLLAEKCEGEFLTTAINALPNDLIIDPRVQDILFERVLAEKNTNATLALLMKVKLPSVKIRDLFFELSQSDPDNPEVLNQFESAVGKNPSLWNLLVNQLLAEKADGNNPNLQLLFSFLNIKGTVATYGYLLNEANKRNVSLRLPNLSQIEARMRTESRPADPHLAARFDTYKSLIQNHLEA